MIAVHYANEDFMGLEIARNGQVPTVSGFEVSGFYV